MAADGQDGITALGAVDLAAAIRGRVVSCAEVMRAYLDRIHRLNPTVNAIVALRDDGALMAEAAAADAGLARGEAVGPLHGFPLAVKDLDAVRGLPFTQGSPIFARRIAEADSIMVARLRAAGAIFTGKTNTPEFGLGSHSFNPVYGTTGNAYDPDRTAGGSSGGAAVAVALRMQPVADGSDHAGSLRNPPAFNNLYGLRPAWGRIPTEAKDVFSPGLAVLGAIGRTPADIGLMLSVQAGYDPRAPNSIRQDPARFASPLARDLSGTRVAWLGDCGGHVPFEPGVLACGEAALATFREIGCTVEAAMPACRPASRSSDPTMVNSPACSSARPTTRRAGGCAGIRHPCGEVRVSASRSPLTVPSAFVMKTDTQRAGTAIRWGTREAGFRCARSLL